MTFDAGNSLDLNIKEKCIGSMLKSSKTILPFCFFWVNGYSSSDFSFPHQKKKNPEVM